MVFVQSDFKPPRVAILDGTLLEVLSPLHAEDDFAAVSASADSIRHVFGPDNGWPAPNMTFAENLADLKRHEQEFNEGYAFAYALFDQSRSRYLGCLYLKPIKSKLGRDKRHELYSAQAFLWFSSLHLETDGQSIFAAVARWLESTWAIGPVAWPGRVQSWGSWESLSKIPANAA